MTTGQLVFYAGVVLLALTGVLAIIFAVKKPKYTPEEAVTAAGAAPTQRLRRGETVPASPVTQRPAGTNLLEHDPTAQSPVSGTQIMSGGDQPSFTPINAKMPVAPQQGATEIMESPAASVDGFTQPMPGTPGTAPMPGTPGTAPMPGATEYMGE